jgi:hypothetical protein
MNRLALLVFVVGVPLLGVPTTQLCTAEDREGVRPLYHTPARACFCDKNFQPQPSGSSHLVGGPAALFPPVQNPDTLVAAKGRAASVPSLRLKKDPCDGLCKDIMSLIVNMISKAFTNHNHPD